MRLLCKKLSKIIKASLKKEQNTSLYSRPWLHLLSSLMLYLLQCVVDEFLETTIAQRIISTTATRATRAPMTAPSTVVVIAVVVPSSNVVGIDVLSVVLMV